MAQLAADLPSTTADAVEPPFGSLAPSPATAALLALARTTGHGWTSARLRSWLYRLAGGPKRQPLDVTVFASQHARLHPGDNLCEKRVLISDRHWEATEQAFLAERVEAAGEVFHFVDVGANAGLYTLLARSITQARRRRLRAVAIEPQAEMLARLRFNLAASGVAAAEVLVCPWAATDIARALTFADDDHNRGRARIVTDGKAQLQVEGRPLMDAVQAGGLPAIDVLKIDIEGAEEPALRAFFDQAPTHLWPQAIIIEAGRGRLDLPGVRLCLERGYAVAGSSRMNALLQRPV